MELDALLLFGNVALRHHYLYRHELEECLGIQERMRLIGGAGPIGSILVDQGYLEPEHVRSILGRQKTPGPSAPELTRFGFLAKANAFLSDKDIDRALGLQKRYLDERDHRLHLGEMLVVQGLLTVAERDALLAAQRRLRGEETPAALDHADGETLLLELTGLERRTGLRGAVTLALLAALAVTAVAALLAAAL